MHKKRIIILGGGISGLATAWYLSQQGYEPILLEKEPRIGGWIETVYQQGLLLEMGPRVFKVSRNRLLLEWIEALGMQGEILFSSPSAHRRYLWMQGSLKKMPETFVDLFSPLGRVLCKALWKEWKTPPSVEEETVWEFACRRFGREAAELFFDPLVVGIYGGDLRKLSIKAVFPSLKQWEETKGSVLRGMLSSLRSRPKLAYPSRALFTLQRGMGSLLQSATSHLRGRIICNEKVEEICWKERKIKTDKNWWQADTIFCALPAKESAKLLYGMDGGLLASIPYQEISSVQVGFQEDCLSVSAFGYLIPSHEKQRVLGCLFDSKIFPQQNRQDFKTRLTFMVAGAAHTKSSLKEIVKEALLQHLNITQEPMLWHAKQMQDAIPQYERHHGEKIENLKKELRSKIPDLYLVGNYLHGVSVNDCLETAKRQVEAFVSSARVDGLY